MYIYIYMIYDISIRFYLPTRPDFSPAKGPTSPCRPLPAPRSSALDSGPARALDFFLKCFFVEVPVPWGKRI